MRFPAILMAAATQGSGKPDADLTAWIAAVVANGGSVSADRAAIVGGFIAAEKASGAWALTDDYWCLWAENAAQALTSLKQRRLATVTAAPTFTADRDYAFNGTSQYIDTGFIPGTHAVSMSLNSIHLDVYERTNVSANTAALGVTSGSNRLLRITPRSTSSAFGFTLTDSATFTLPAADSRGLTQIGRNGALVTDTYGAKNGADMVRAADPTALGASLPSHSLYIGAANSAGTAANFRASSIGFAACGAALSQAQRLARYNAVQAWATAVGAQV